MIATYVKQRTVNCECKL